MKKPKKKNRLDHALAKTDREEKEQLKNAISANSKKEVKRLAREKRRIIKKLWRDGNIDILISRPLDKGA